MRVLGRLALTLALGAVLLGAAGCGGDDDTSPPSDRLQRIDGGEPVALFEGTGRPTVVNLWATWCVPCRQELPAFDEVAAAAGDDVDVFGVNVGDDAADAEALVDELGLTFPQLLDPDSTLSAELDVVNMPTTAFLDAEGTVVEVHAGALTAEEIVEAVDEHLGVTVDLP